MRLVAVLDAHHRDALVDWADERTEVAADAVFFPDFRHRLARDAAGAEADADGFGELDALVRAIFARNVAEVAANALVVVDARDALPVEIEVSHFCSVWTERPRRSSRP